MLLLYTDDEGKVLRIHSGPVSPLTVHMFLNCYCKRKYLIPRKDKKPKQGVWWPIYSPYGMWWLCEGCCTLRIYVGSVDNMTKNFACLTWPWEHGYINKLNCVRFVLFFIYLLLGGVIAWPLKFALNIDLQPSALVFNLDS